MKAGWKTTEFWLSLATAVTPFLTDAVPGWAKAVAAGLAAAAYSWSRGQAKRGPVQ